MRWNLLGGFGFTPDSMFSRLCSGVESGVGLTFIPPNFYAAGKISICCGKKSSCFISLILCWKVILAIF